jgi:hypothetical protein
VVADQLAAGPPAMGDRASVAEWLQVLLMLVVFVTLFLWKPITSRDYYAPADLSQATTVLRTTPAARPVSNSELGEVSSNILPWQMFDAAQVKKGELPLWNPYNESGIPHLANGQSAPLSPFNAPFYVLSLRAALIVSVAMVLMAAGLFTYGLARHLGAAHLGGLVAAVGFAFAGVNIVWLRWPIAAAASLLPAIVWTALGVVDASTRRRRWLAAAALAVAVAVSLVSGRPETTFYSLVGATVLVVGRFVLARMSRSAILRRIGVLVGAVVGGMCLAAVQVLPTLEYVSHRASSGQRQAFVGAKFAGLLAFPFANGSPFGTNRSGVLPIVIPYIKGVELYMGAGFVFLAIVGWLAVARQRRAVAAVMAVLGVLWVLFIFDAAGFGRLVTRLPGLDGAVSLRSIPLWALAISLLAAHGTTAVRHALVEGRLARRRAVIDITIAVAVVAVVGFALLTVINHELPKVVTSASSSASSIRHEHFAYIIGWLIVAVAAVLAPVVLMQGRDRRRGLGALIRVASGVALLIALFASSGYLWRDWNPTVPRSLVYARSSALDGIQDVVGNDLALRLDSSLIPPDLNLAYGIRSPESDDANGIEDYQALYRRLLHPADVLRDATSVGLLAGPVTPSGIGNLRMLGIQWVTTGTAYPFADGLLTGPNAAAGRSGKVAWIVAPSATGPTQINQLVVSSLSISPGSRCRFEIRAQRGHVQTVATPCGSPGVSVALAHAVAVGNGFAVSLSITDAHGRALAIKSGASITAVDTKVVGLELTADVEGYRVFRVPGAPDHVFSPASTASSDPGHKIVSDPDAQPTKLSVVDDREGESSGSESGAVHVSRDQPGDIRFEVTRSTPGWVVVMEASYPGWQATVDGDDAPVREANGAFLAVQVPAGTSSVTVRYQPRSVEIGAVLSLAALALLLVLVAWMLWGGWRRRHGRAGP